jgi:hypothetical protein
VDCVYPDLVAVLIGELGDNAAVVVALEKGLLAAGYHEYAALRYHRQFSYLMTSVYEVEGSFPRLTKGNVPSGVIDAIYRIELDVAGPQSPTMAETLLRLGQMNDSR